MVIVVSSPRLSKTVAENGVLRTQQLLFLCHRIMHAVLRGFWAGLLLRPSAILQSICEGDSRLIKASEGVHVVYMYVTIEVILCCSLMSYDFMSY